MLRRFGVLVMVIIVTVNGQTFSVEEDKDIFLPLHTGPDILDWALLKEFASEENNVLFSPISLRIVLALLYQGSNPDTSLDFQNVLQFVNEASVSNRYRNILISLQDSEDDGHLFSIISRIFLSSDIAPEPYFTKIARDFKTDIEPIDFSRTNFSETINSWLRELTKGRITQLVKLEELKELAILVTNAVYFKGTWRYQFSNNFFGNFYLFKDTDVLLLLRTVTVPYMSIVGTFYYSEDKVLNAKFLRLPYKKKRCSMFIILPNSKGGLSLLLKRINVYNVKTLRLRMDRKIVNLTLPKFRINYEQRMAPTLEKLGMFEIFHKLQLIPTTTTWDEISRKSQTVSEVIQKAGVEVDDTGAYAVKGNTTEEVEVIFEATHPFIFFIQDDFERILLFGKMENPIEEPVILPDF